MSFLIKLFSVKTHILQNKRCLEIIFAHFPDKEKRPLPKQNCHPGSGADIKMWSIKLIYNHVEDEVFTQFPQKWRQILKIRLKDISLLGYSLQSLLGLFCDRKLSPIPVSAH